MVDFAREWDKLPNIWSMFKHMDEWRIPGLSDNEESYSDSVSDSEASSDISPVRTVLKKKIEKGIAHSLSIIRREEKKE